MKDTHRVAIFTFLSTIAAISIYQSISKTFEVQRFKKEASVVDWDSFEKTKTTSKKQPISPSNAKAITKYQSAEYQELVQEQLSRNALFLGKDGLKRVRSAFVVVVGLGGVGSHAAHMLVRAGVERIRLVDFDQVTLSSLNRHAVANRSDVGIPKVTAMKKHLLEIVPHAEIEDVVQLFSIDDADKLLEGNPDFVLDCIDNLETKIQLIAHCRKHDLKIIASMGKSIYRSCIHSCYCSRSHGSYTLFTIID